MSKSFDIVEKLADTALELGYDEALQHGFFRGIDGFSPKIFYCNEKNGLYNGYVDLEEFIEDNFDNLKNRDSVGKRLIKRKSNFIK